MSRKPSVVNNVSNAYEGHGNIFVNVSERTEKISMMTATSMFGGGGGGRRGRGRRAGKAEEEDFMCNDQ
jgi:hypothetical protein